MHEKIFRPADVTMEALKSDNSTSRRTISRRLAYTEGFCKQYASIHSVHDIQNPIEATKLSM